jgi:hypothetical protein
MFTRAKEYSPGEIRVGYNYSLSRRILILILSLEEGLIIENSTEISYLQTDFPVNLVIPFRKLRNHIATWPLLFPYNIERPSGPHWGHKPSFRPRPQKLK